MSALITFLAVAVVLLAAWTIPTALAWAFMHGTTWATRNIVATDPSPEYSRIDRLDGL